MTTTTTTTTMADPPRMFAAEKVKQARECVVERR
jgi:hypothetical protein